jgi:hypothetical protein
MILALLKRWLGWDPEIDPFNTADPGPPAHERRKAQRPLIYPTAATRESPPQPPPKERRPKPERTPLDVLDNPHLTLDKPADDGFDPYNTGAFNRSASWERIGRHKKR